MVDSGSVTSTRREAQRKAQARWNRKNRDKINAWQRRRYRDGAGKARAEARAAREALLPSRNPSRKACKKCERDLPIEAYSLARGHRDGHRSECGECQRKANNARYAAHSPEQKARDLEYRRKHYQKNRDKMRAQIKAWNENNKNTERYKLAHIAKESKRRALARETGNITADMLLGIVARDGSRCYLCGKSVADNDRSFDHVIPLVIGGPNIPENIALTHRRCNSAKGARLVRLC